MSEILWLVYNPKFVNQKSIDDMVIHLFKADPRREIYCLEHRDDMSQPFYVERETLHEQMSGMDIGG